MRNRKAYLMTRKATGSTMAFDELGEVDDPIALICKWVNENLESADIQRLMTELGKISEFGEDDLLEGVRPARRVAGHGYMGQDSAMRGDGFEQIFGVSPKVEHSFQPEGRSSIVESRSENDGDFAAIFGGNR